MKLDLSRYAPPGHSLRTERNVLLYGLVFSAVISLNFFLRFSDALGWLYRGNGSSRTLVPGAVMPDFVVLLDRSLIGFFVLAACMAAFAIDHYLYHRRESKSIYLMRRLPDRWELYRRCLTLPLLAAAACLLAALLVLLLYLAIYLTVTPDVCLTPGQWRKIWSVRL